MPLYTAIIALEDNDRQCAIAAEALLDWMSSMLLASWAALKSIARQTV